MTGQRYAQVTDQSIRYALGHFGGDVETLMDPAVRARILDRPRARELAAVEFQQLSEAQIRRDLGAEGVSEDDLLLRYLLRKDDIERMRASPTGSGPVKEYDTEGDAMVSLISELSRLAGGNTVRISKPGFSLTLGKGAP
jgi:oxaloacetate decarboxylase alpha subunit